MNLGRHLGLGPVLGPERLLLGLAILGRQLLEPLLPGAQSRGTRLRQRRRTRSRTRARTCAPNRIRRRGWRLVQQRGKDGRLPPLLAGALHLALLVQHADNTVLTQFHSRMHHHAQVLLVRRRLTLAPFGLVDDLVIENTSDENQVLRLGHRVDADFIEIIEARGHLRQAPRAAVDKKVEEGRITFSYVAVDGVVSRTEIAWMPRTVDPFDAIEIAPRQTLAISFDVKLSTTLGCASGLPALEPWTPSIARTGFSESEAKILDQAIADIDALQVMTPEGRSISAGIPNFVAPFGRDSIITSWLLLDVDPDLARSVLGYLAAKQSSGTDVFRDAEPGKIMHEHRESELNRIGELPFATYYGTADSSALFLMLFGDYVARTGDTDLARALEINSADSLSYADGTLARGALAVAEIQGYSFAAYRAAVTLSEACGGSQEERDEWTARAAKLKQDVDRLYWMPKQQSYALALDADNRWLDVVASDAGHLLWTGIVPQEKASLVIARLFAPDMWTGYGLRTLSYEAKRYNPLSYHNGSVWPHDTALFAAGLLRYGALAEARRIREGLTALALESYDLRLPELVGGYVRQGDVPPLPYLESCRPQAWSAAAMIYVLTAIA
ncbi:MAG: glycogen debranching N-terminal domain-containing protein [Novosphingobium sp.]